MGVRISVVQVKGRYARSGMGQGTGQGSENSPPHQAGERGQPRGVVTLIRSGGSVLGTPHLRTPGPEKPRREFSGGPVTKTLRFHCQGCRFDPWSRT